MTEKEEELEKLAMNEILLEAKRGADRATEMGVTGWQKPVIASTNKRFLRNTLLSTLRHPGRRPTSDRPHPDRPRPGDKGRNYFSGPRRSPSHSDSRHRSRSPERRGGKEGGRRDEDEEEDGGRTSERRRRSDTTGRGSERSRDKRKREGK